MKRVLGNLLHAIAYLLGAAAGLVYVIYFAVYRILLRGEQPDERR